MVSTGIYGVPSDALTDVQVQVQPAPAPQPQIQTQPAQPAQPAQPVQPVQPVQPKPTAPPDFPTEVLSAPGFIGEYVKHASETTFPQDQLACGGALALMSVLTGRKVQDSYKGTRSNIYACGVAPTGAGKEQARRINKQILTAIGADDMIGPERVASSAGFVKWLESQPATLYQLDEFGRFMQTCTTARATHLYNVVTVMMTLYTSSGQPWRGDAYADIKNIPKIYDPHAVVYATSTPNAFWESFTPNSVVDGLIGRFMLFEGKYVESAEDEDEDDDEDTGIPVPGHMIDFAKMWFDFNPGGGNMEPVACVAKYDREAKRRVKSHIKEISKKRIKEEEVRAAVWSRTSERTTKLALLFAMSRQTPAENGLRITIEDVEYAIRLSNYQARRIIKACGNHLAGNDQHRKVNTVKRLIGKHQPVTKSDLIRKTPQMRGKERDEILQELINSDQIQAFSDIASNGKLVTTYLLSS